MLQTLFCIPDQIGGIPVFGFGLLLAVWAVFSVGFVAWLAVRQGFNSDTLSYIPLLLVIGAILAWLLPRIIEPGIGLPIRGYGMMMLLGVVAGTALSVWRGRGMGIDTERIVTLVFWGFVPGIACARLFYVVEYWHEFMRPSVEKPELGPTLGAILNVTEGGLVVYGSLIGGMAGFIAFCLREKLPLLRTMDVLAPGMLLGLALGRIGCFLNGCCFGGPCDLPWAVQFPAGSPPYVYQVHHGQIVPPTPEEIRAGEVFAQGLKLAGSPRGPAVISAVEPGSAAEAAGLKAGQRLVSLNHESLKNAEEAQQMLAATYRAGPWITATVAEVAGVIHWRASGPPPRSHAVHPTQLYSTLDAFVLCFLLLAFDPFRRRDGQVVALMLTLYPVTRFLMEMIRTDEPKRWLVGLSIGQVVSLLILSTAVGLWMYLFRKPTPQAGKPGPRGPGGIHSLDRRDSRSG